MAKARVTIDCHHCGKRTVIDLMEEMSTQRCMKCGLRLNSVNTSAHEKRRKKVSGDPMLNKYEKSEESGQLRRRRYFSPRRWRIVKVVLLLTVFAILIITTYVVITNPMGVHRRW